jgi:hypothetical protein
MTLQFECETEPTLDGSYPIIVRSITKTHEEYVFQFACNREELLGLRDAAFAGLAEANKERRKKTR